MNKVDLIIEEQYFPYMDMSLEERNFCLSILKNCKDICDTDQKVGNKSKCEIVQMNFKKQNSKLIKAEGSLIIKDNKVCEVRAVEADIYLEKAKVIVDMHINRLCANDKNREYTVLDIFEFENDKLKRTSEYNYEMKRIVTEINDNELGADLNENKGYKR